MGAGRHHLLRQEGLPALSRERTSCRAGRGPLPAGSRRVSRAARPRGREGHPPRCGGRALLAHDARRAGLHARGRALGGADRSLGGRDGAGRSRRLSSPGFASERRVTLFTEATAIDLITARHHSRDVAQRYASAGPLPRRLRARREREKSTWFLADFTVLATGGVGRLFLHTTNTLPRDRRRSRHGRAGGRGHAEPRVRPVPSHHALPPGSRGLLNLRGPARRRSRAREPRGRAVHAGGTLRSSRTSLRAMS